ncbi:DUF2237 family protein [Acidithiobacillus caldus]|uniref:DUF2237 domain-containing protein n=1 Tax=Acidithiobacillus caldus TaxID=33059 RepID=A0A1E7YRE7_9PROT|nr:DUF2237 domain-containing protein [Acidithiobacillus caldus]OFC36099.1 hypothetical protein BAE29_13785 [Acidithiobacillus caldus]OFC39154.1 hypothetical protein BAE27_00385 [Acidithiobacillus caldus]OFC39795.1 hypothetical protein BAE28_02315 [Acidithiobacillus caldus]
MSENVLGTALLACGFAPKTGFYRDGFCRAGREDGGMHGVCAVVTEAFLSFSRDRGNDLITPRPQWDFPGLQPGDRWCLCALRWKEALLAGCAPPVVLEATDAVCLKVLNRDDLLAHAWAARQ